MTVKKRVLWVLLAAAIIVIVVVAGQTMDSLIGSVWHLTHSSELQYGNARINVPLGWFPLMRKGSLAMVKYPKDGSVITFTNETRHISHDPKEAMESIGRIFHSADKIVLEGSEGIKITTQLQEDTKPYSILITIPSQNLTISYLGPQENIGSFNKILEGLTFVKPERISG